MTEITVVSMTEADARRLTERIRITAVTARESIEKLQALLTEAREGNAHTALGYASWTAYLAAVMGEQPLRLPRDQRQELVGYLAGEGMSSRAIAPIVGATDRQVRRDMGGTNVPPAQTPPPAIPQEEPVSRDVGAGLNVNQDTGEILDAPQPRKVTGLDGKEYSRPEPRTPTGPRRKPYLDDLAGVVHALSGAAEKLQALIADDRYSQNATQAATENRDDLIRVTGVLQGAVQQMS